MIHLDANYLILCTSASAPESARVEQWLREGESLSASAVAWMEFITGPVSPSLVESVRRIVADRIVPIGREEAELAARLFNAIGRKRAARYDCMIAASSINSGARLATNNTADYRAFTFHGLKLA